MIIFNALQATLSGGIGRYCYELSKELYKISDELKVVIREEDIELFNFLKKEDIILVKGIKNSIARNYFEQFKLPFIIKKKYPNAIIHYPDSMGPLFSKNKYVITVHDVAFTALDDIFTWKTRLWKKISTKFSVKKADKIIVISEYTKNELIKFYGDDLIKKIKVVYNGFNDFSNDEISLNNIRKNIIEISRNRYILTVSTISPRKNIDGLIKAYNQMKNKEKYRLVIVGENGWLYEDIFKLVNQFNLRDKVIFTGKINDDELKFLYKNCSLFAYISFYEGFGLPPLEAMSYKKRCIVSNATSLPEVVGDSAEKVDPNNIFQISSLMEGLLEKNHLNYDDIVKIENNIKRFSWEKSANDTYLFYKRN